MTEEWKSFDREKYHNAIITGYTKIKNAKYNNTIKKDITRSEVNTNKVKNKFRDTDDLIIIDMQYDFLPMYKRNDDQQWNGGAFAVYEGEQIISSMTSLIQKFPGNIYATKDYHPENHCSFLTQGGKFPPHCIWNKKGSKIIKPIYNKLKDKKSKTKILYKGFSPDVDSFGGIQYTQNSSSHNRFKGCNCSQFTTSLKCKDIKNKNNNWFGGSYTLVAANNNGNNPVKLKANNFNASKQYTLNQNVNLEQLNSTSLLHRTNNKSLIKRILNTPLHKLLLGNNLNTTKNIYVCGLAGDWCVLDTCLNLAALTKNYKKIKIHYLLDFTRWSYVEALGGRLTDPYEIGEMLAKAGIILQGERKSYKNLQRNRITLRRSEAEKMSINRFSPK